MKVLHIITGLSQGGAESALFRLVTYKNINCDHVIVSMTDMGIYGSKLRDAGIEVYSLDMPRRKLKLKSCFKLFKIIKAISPDVIQTWMYHADLLGGLAARWSGFKNVAWGIVNFNLNPLVASSSTRWAAKLCAKISGFIPRKIVSCSEKAVAVHQAIGYSKTKFVTIPLGYDLSEFRPYPDVVKTLLSEWGINKDEVVIGCVARWDPQKDHGNLLRALAILNEKEPLLRCVLAGPGMDRKNIELVTLINNTLGTNNNIILAGLCDNIAAVMGAFDFHVLPSLGEAFPNVVAEAMACRTPCIVTDVGDASVIVGDTGWVVPPANSQAMAAAIEKAIYAKQDKEAWEKRRTYSRERIRHNFSMNSMSRAYENLWKSMLNK